MNPRSESRQTPSRARSFFARLTALQTRAPGRFAGVALALGALSIPLILQLGLDSRWTALLPSDKPSIRDLEQIKDRVGGLSTLIVAVESPSKDVAALKRFGKDLAQRVEQLPDRYVRTVDWNVRDYKDFLWTHRHLYAPTDELEEIRDAIEERADYERLKANPFFIDLENEEPADPKELIADMESWADAGEKKFERYPGGFYLHPDRNLLAIFVRSDLSGGEAVGGRELVAKVQSIADELDPSSYGRDLRVQFGGDVVVGGEEHKAIAKELTIATSLTLALVLLAIYLFFGRVRAIVLLGAAVTVPVLVTFAVSELLVDYLNTSTAFLGSIVLGNGVNPNIIWLARYFEERRKGHGARRAILETHCSTWIATLTASTAAGLAYASLILTDFRGFRDFGIIGGIGMALCWLGALLLLPALAALMERFAPMRWSTKTTSGDTKRFRWSPAAFFGQIASRAPRTTVLVSGTIGLLSLAAVGYAVAHDPLEYDFRNLKSVRDDRSPGQEVNSKVNAIVGSVARGNGIVVFVPNADEAESIERQLEARSGALWKTVHSVHDLLPAEQTRKIELLDEIRDLLTDLRPRVDVELQAKIDTHIPPQRMTPLTAEDLPAQVARTFSERDGTRGRILLVEESEDFSIWDGAYLVRWSRALRESELTSGSPPPLAGRGPVFADMLEAVWTDGPRAILASFLATLFLCIVAFRSLRERLLTVGALLLGIAWMGATMALMGLRLNFLNFVAFPITFGNGVDYSVNVMKRYSIERARTPLDAARIAVTGTGGAVVLCSLTTIIGYTSLYASANLAIRSFGTAMAISEVTCLIAAVVTMPAMLLWLDRRGAPEVPAAVAPPPNVPSRPATDPPSGASPVHPKSAA